MDAIQWSFTASTYCLVTLACGLGLLGVAGLRLGGRWDHARMGSCLFFLCFMAQAALAMLAMVCNNNAWLIFGGVFAAMAIGATLDLGRSSSASVC